MRGLRGFVGQDMSGKRREPRPILYKIVDLSVAGAAEIVADHTGHAQLFLWGAGGSGNASTGGSRLGGGAGGALYIDGPVTKGQSMGYLLGAGGAAVSADANGNAGADSTLTFGGLVYRATGGGAGGPGSAVGTGGVGQAQGRATTRTGAAGGGGSANAPTGEDGGGAGGGFDANNAGGGGAPGFASLITGLTYGIGSTGGGTATRGAGGGGTSNGTASGAGGPGRILAYLYRFD